MGIKQVEVHLVQVYCLVVKRSCLRYHTSFKVLTARVILPGGQLWKYVWEHYVRQNFRCRSRHIEAARNSRKRFRAPGRKKKKLTRTSVQIKSVPRWTKHRYKFPVCAFVTNIVTMFVLVLTTMALFNWARLPKLKSLALFQGSLSTQWVGISGKLDRLSSSLPSLALSQLVFLPTVLPTSSTVSPTNSSVASTAESADDDLLNCPPTVSTVSLAVELTVSLGGSFTFLLSQFDILLLQSFLDISS